MKLFYNGYPSLSAFTRGRLWFLIFMGLLLAQQVMANSGAHMLPLTLERRLQESDMVIEGEVISKRSFWDEKHENIYTSNIIKIYKVFKGELQQDQLEVITEGGTVGLDKHVYSVALTLKPGQQGMFFLKRLNTRQATPAKINLTTRPYGSEQGFIHYNTQTLSAKGVFEEYATIEQVYNAITTKTRTNYKTIGVNQQLQQSKTRQQVQASPNAPVITTFSPRTASGGTRTVLTINGTGFGNSRGTGAVYFRDADDGGTSFTEAPEDAYISWTNIQIRLYIPSTGEDGGTAGTGEIRVTANDGLTTTSVDKITIPYSYSNLYEEDDPNPNDEVPGTFKSYQPALINVDGQGGYTIKFAPSMQSRTNAQEGFIRAMNSWVCATGVNWKIGAPTTKEASASDDEVIVMFAPQSKVGENVLARTLSRYRGCQVIATREISWWLSEFDMEINSNISWQYGPGPPTGNQFDFETVMLHELGHAHQLSHVILPNVAVMHYALEFRKYYRQLSQADIDGGNFIMNRSLQPNICNRPLIVPKEGSECNLAEEVLSIQAAYSAGDVVLNWNTNTETGIARYIIERSADGITFEEIGTVAASADNTFTDTDPLPRSAFYRLRVIYTDNEDAYSPRARVTDPGFLYIFEAGPNPVGADGKFSVSYLVDRNTPAQLFLYDTSGKIVRSFEVVFTDANLPLEFDLTGVSPGLYILKWTSDRSSGSTRIVKL